MQSLLNSTDGLERTGERSHRVPSEKPRGKYARCWPWRYLFRFHLSYGRISELWFKNSGFFWLYIKCGSQLILISNISKVCQVNANLLTYKRPKLRVLPFGSKVQTASRRRNALNRTHDLNRSSTNSRVTRRDALVSFSTYKYFPELLFLQAPSSNNLSQRYSHHEEPKTWFYSLMCYGVGQLPMIWGAPKNHTD